MPRKTRATNAMEHPVKMAFTVPEEDRVVLDWIGAQNNLSTSLRLLIKEVVPKTGYVDYLTSLPLGQNPAPVAVPSPEATSTAPPTPAPVVTTEALPEAPSQEISYIPDTLSLDVSSETDERLRDLKSMLDA